MEVDGELRLLYSAMFMALTKLKYAIYGILLFTFFIATLEKGVF